MPCKHTICAYVITTHPCSLSLCPDVHAAAVPVLRVQLAREVCLHMRSCHTCIASLYAAYKDSRHIYLLMELAPNGNLYQMLMALPVPAVSAWELAAAAAAVGSILDKAATSC
eukprot:GHRQ01037381.1.p3 GENE.GHRQ01037381.1~~GHRQ01037381.1.p3  ORF type:complete len:113 (+),score=40.25 GHRQ01037381.1:164-502(+)